MALDGVNNFAKVEVSTGYDASATSIVLATGDGAKLPDPATANYNVVWWNSTDYPDPADDPNVEIVRVTAKSTDTLTVTRNQESSGASTKNTAGKTYKMILGITAKMITDIAAEIAAGGGVSTDVITAYRTSDQSMDTSATTIAYNVESGDTNNELSAGGVFTAASNGVRRFDWNICVDSTAGNAWLNAYDGTNDISGIAYINTFSQTQMARLSYTVNMSTNDTVELRMQLNSGTSSIRGHATVEYLQSSVQITKLT